MRHNTFLICGPSRVGKSKLSEFISDTYQYQWMQMDCLITAMQGGFDQEIVSFNVTKEQLGASLERFFHILIAKQSRYGRYVYDSDVIFPELAWKLAKEIGAKSIFLGFGPGCQRFLVDEFREYSTQKSCYTKNLDDHELNQLVEDLIRASLTIKQQCHSFGIPYLERNTLFADFLTAAQEQVKTMLACNLVSRAVP